MRQFSPQAVRQRRRRAGKSRDQVGWELGKGYQTVAAWESGRATPPLPTALRLAEALGCELDDLLAEPTEDGDAA